jgi:5-methyltetrahydrofolate--homocysteine methyltransferase
MEHGLSQGEAPEAWNLHNPGAVLAVASAYVLAGSDLILTNSFGASRLQLERHGLADQTFAINRRAAELSVQAIHAGAPGRRLVIVAGDIGPCGKLFIMGEVAEETLYNAFLEQARALHAGGAQWLLIETMIDRSEMAVAVRAAASTGLPVAATMTYERTATGYRTVMGDSPADCIASAREAGASIVGANCGAGIDSYIDLARELRALCDCPLWIKANAGLPTILDGQTVYRMKPGEYCSYIPALLDIGVNIIGGCCGTSPDFIAAARQLIT